MGKYSCPHGAYILVGMGDICYELIPPENYGLEKKQHGLYRLIFAVKNTPTKPLTKYSIV